MGAFCRTNHSEAKHAGSVFIYAGAPLPEGSSSLGLAGPPVSVVQDHSM